LPHGREVRPASGLGLLAVRPRIPADAGHTRSAAGTIQAKFPPASLRRLGYDVVGTLRRFYEVGGPALHACLGPTGIRSARLSQGETPVPTKNKNALTGPGPSLDEPCLTHKKVWHASGLGLWTVRPRMPAHACSYAAGTEGREFPPASQIRGRVSSRSLGASQQNIHRCDENVLRTPAYWCCHCVHVAAASIS